MSASRLPTPAAAWIGDLLSLALSRPLVVVVPNEAEAYAWLEAVTLMAPDRPAIYLPAPPLGPLQETEVSLVVRAEESMALDRIAGGGKRGAVSTIVCTPRSLFRRWPTRSLFRTLTRTIHPGEEHPPTELAAFLINAGYRRTELVVEVGEMAIRGGVFDFFPPGEPGPVRLDLFGDTVESIQRFEPETQRSIEHLDVVRALPLGLFPEGAEEAEILAELLAEMSGPDTTQEVAERLGQLRNKGGYDGWQQLLPLLARETVGLCSLVQGAEEAQPLVVTLDRETLIAEAREHWQLLIAEFEGRRDDGRLAVAPELLEHPLADVLSDLDHAALRLGEPLDDLADRTSTVDFGATLTDPLHDQLPRLAREVSLARSRDERVLLVGAPDHRARLVEMLDTLEITEGHSGIELIAGDLGRGFRLPDAGLTVFGERQLVRRSPLTVQRRRPRDRYGPFLSSLRDLRVGDYVVHVDHGIGQFVGLRAMGESGSGGPELPPSLAGVRPQETGETEVMEIVYATGQRLLMPLARLDQIQKYSGIEGVSPRLDRLGGTSWKRTKRRIKKGMRDMAEELLKLYAERQMAEAPPMAADSELQQQFEAAFSFDETPDQLEAIGAIKHDLESTRPMDRLLCGDVGFGKTEVAVRAAFKAVDNGYQVAVLAPTTILADQHLETFRKRCKGFPVRVEMVSRFCTPAEVRDTRQRLADGTLDIVIGTHRLLGKSFSIPKLGLMIVDEEQRFGVAHKERLKHMRKDVHVLAMSATPVPRTLQLSLAGVRELSLIETPPRDRMAVETAIVPFDAQLIREALSFEKERGGQIFYVYNEVESIERMSSYLRELMPDLRITVGHGQMDEHELARRMHAFVAGDYDLLLATTIIENGIDIPNVNTMIVHDAQRFGLSQLYQLRGRVGRSDQLAYCYLLVPQDRVLSEQARKRLSAIREFTELGAGFRVAGRDLEIRGAGNLLGAEQSGHIGAVGIDTYLRMLEETVAELRGETVPEAPSVTMDLPVPMAIPQSYIEDANLRMEVYHRIVTGDATEDEILAELRDRFGTPPDAVHGFIQVVLLKRLAEELRLQSIAARKGTLYLRLRQDAKLAPDRLIELVSNRPGARFSPDGVLSLDGIAAADLVTTARETLEALAA